MKIGFYGGMANNMYVMAKAFAQKGADICFIRDHCDHFAFSQPVWEDKRIYLSHDMLYQTYHWTISDWKSFETKQGWKPPEWFQDPVDCFETADPYRTANDLETAAFENLRYLGRYYWGDGVSQWLTTLHLMRRCDILVVCDIAGAILASASRVPFIIWPCGGDVQSAAGLNRPQNMASDVRQIYRLRQYLLKKAFKKAQWLGFNLPEVPKNDFIEVISPQYPVRYFPIPVQTHKRLSKQERRKKLSQLLRELNLPPAADVKQMVIFVPSRIHFEWKGIDRLILAIKKLSPEDQKRIHVYFSGWGPDYEKVKTMISPETVTFMTCVLSKPILYDFMSAADLVVDQFVLGYYGTSGMEAMAHGAPLMLWLEPGVFKAPAMTPPPVLNARYLGEIYESIKKILDGGLDLEKVAAETHAWMQNTYGSSLLVSQEVKMLEEALLARS